MCTNGLQVCYLVRNTLCGFSKMNRLAYIWVEPQWKDGCKVEIAKPREKIPETDWFDTIKNILKVFARFMT